MPTPVVTVASGGLPVVVVTVGNKLATPVREASNGYGIPVTQVTANGVPVIYSASGPP